MVESCQLCHITELEDIFIQLDHFNTTWKHFYWKLIIFNNQTKLSGFWWENFSFWGPFLHQRDIRQWTAGLKNTLYLKYSIQGRRWGIDGLVDKILCFHRFIDRGKRKQIFSKFTKQFTLYVLYIPLIYSRIQTLHGPFFLYLILCCLYD